MKPYRTYTCSEVPWNTGKVSTCAAQPLLHSVRLNKITTVVPDEPDLLRHVTQLDVRDNRLPELDACIFPKLEMLHCERNRIVCLRAKGSFLKGIYASSNGGFFPMRDVWLGKTDLLYSRHRRLADFCLSDLISWNLIHLRPIFFFSVYTQFSFPRALLWIH